MSKWNAFAVLYVMCYLWQETFTALDVKKIFRSRVQIAKMNSPWPMALIDFEIAGVHVSSAQAVDHRSSKSCGCSLNAEI